MRILLTTLIAIALATASYFYWAYTDRPELELITATRTKAVEAVYATAVVEPVNWSAIAPLKTGRITEILVEEGDTVQESQTLARVDDADLQKRYEEVKAREELQLTELDRAQKLHDKGFASQETIDRRGAELSQTMAARKRIEEEIRQLSLTAPRDGIVLWRDVEPGEVKQSGETLFWIGRPKPLRLNAKVDEEDIPKIEKGQTVLISSDAFPDQIMQAEISQITPKGDPVNKSYRVYMALPENTKLMIGMTVETNTIIQEKQDALMVPATAVLDGHVFRVGKNNDLEKIAVTTGISGEDKIEILQGLKENDQIIQRPTPALEDNQTIRVE